MIFLKQFRIIREYFKYTSNIVATELLLRLVRIRHVQLTSTAAVFNRNFLYSKMVGYLLKIVDIEISALLDKNAYLEMQDKNSRIVPKYLYAPINREWNSRKILLNKTNKLYFLMDENNHNSKKISKSLNNILNFTRITDISAHRPGDYIFFATPLIYQQLRSMPTGSNWIYGDKAFFGRGQYYRFALNKRQLNTMFNTCPKRFNALNLKLSNRNRKGEKIIICPQSEIFHDLVEVERSVWLGNTISKLRRYTDREIVIRAKRHSRTEEDFSEALVDAYCVVVMSSIAGVQAVMHGVPCIATDVNSTSAMFGETQLSAVNDLELPPNRYELLCNLANNQWTLDEINSGQMLQSIREYSSK